jgi:O-antigen ligase
MTVSRLAGGACGALAALYLLTGRWTLSRLSEEAATPRFHDEIRFWVVLLLVAAALLTSAPRLTSPGRRGGIAVLLLAALFYYLLASATWAPDAELAAAKAYEVALVALATLGLARALASRESEHVLRSMWAAILVTAGALAAVAVARVVALGATGERLAVLGGGPNTFARIMGYLAVAALFFWTRRGRSWAFMPIVSVALVLVLLSGSRGGLVALVAAVGVFVALEVRRAGRLLAGALVAAAVFALAASYTQIGRAAVETYEQRVAQLLLQEQYTAGRTELYRSAYELGMREPLFGDGLAAFPARALGVYPHNLFLEAFCEAGIVGLGLLALALAAGTASALRGGRAPEGAALAAFVLVLVASQFSGDLYDSRGVFAFLVAANLRPGARGPFPGEAPGVEAGDAGAEPASGDVALAGDRPA